MNKPRLSGVVCACVIVLTTNATKAATVAFTDQASFIAATSSLTVDDFEGNQWLPANIPLSQPVVSLGNSWTSDSGLGSITNFFASIERSITSLDAATDLKDTINATLGETDTAVGGFVFLDFLDPTAGVTLSAFDAGNTLLGSVTTTLHSGWQFIGLTSDTAIATIEFISTISPPNDDFLLDDFHFGTASPVPVPAAAWLFGSGLLGLIGVSRRKAA